MPSSSLPKSRSLSLLVALVWSVQILFAAAAGAVPALFDFGNSTVQAGWVGVTSSNPTAVSEGIQLELAATNAAGFGVRDRGTNNGGGTEADMWRDFLFAEVASPPGGEGLDITLTGLVADAFYDVTIWAFDFADPVGGPRSALWNGEPFSFTPSMLPSTLADDNVTLLVQADGSGAAQVLGISQEFGRPGAFINGMSVELSAIPEPSAALLLGLGLVWLTGRRERPDGQR